MPLAGLWPGAATNGAKAHASPRRSPGAAALELQVLRGATLLGHVGFRPGVAVAGAMVQASLWPSPLFAAFGWARRLTSLQPGAKVQASPRSSSCSAAFEL